MLNQIHCWINCIKTQKKFNWYYFCHSTKTATFQSHGKVDSHFFQWESTSSHKQKFVEISIPIGILTPISHGQPNVGRPDNLRRLLGILKYSMTQMPHKSMGLNQFLLE